MMSLMPFIFLNGYSKKNVAKPTEDIPWDIVPDAKTAVKVAEAVWLPVYGKSVLREKPYVAELKDSSVWIVKGTLPKGYRGGVAYIEIQKKDCKVLNMYHGK